MEIAIIGSGITGLTTAIALRERGFVGQVYERSAALTEVGAGVWLQPNAMKILDQLGLGPSLRARGAMLSEVRITNSKLKPLRKSPQIKGQARLTLSIHRARLQQCLYEALPADTVQLGAQYQTHERQGERIAIVCAGLRSSCDLLLGADGIHSPVRAHCFPDSSLRYAGQTCWRGIASISLPDEFAQLGQEAWGQGTRFGFAPISAQEVYWFAVAKAQEGGQDRLTQRRQGLEHSFARYHPLVREIIAHTPDNKILRNDIYDLHRLKAWHQGPVCLLGDAAHATTPNMGQGACQGIEDAWVISRLLANPVPYAQTFARFEKIRRSKVDYVVNTSWRFGQMAHGRLSQRLLRGLMKVMPEKAIVRQLEQLDHIDEEAALLER